MDLDALDRLRQLPRDRLALAIMAASAPPRTVGMSRAEIEAYSFRNLISSLHGGQIDAGLEREASQAVEAQLASEVRNLVPDGFQIVPNEVLVRAMTSTPGSAGGYLIGNQIAGFVDFVRPHSIALRMGAQSWPNLKSSVTFGRAVGDVTVTWQSWDGASVTGTEQTLGQLSLTPKTAIALTDVSEQLLQQGGETVERVVPRVLAAAAGSALDNAVFQGAGGAQPLGIPNQPGVTIGQDASSATYAKLLGFPTAAGDAILQAPGFATTLAGSTLLAQKSRFTNSDTPLWTGNVVDGELIGFPAMSSSNVADDHLIFGSWGELIVADWGVLAIAADRSGTRFNTAQVGIRALWLVDVALLHPQSFVVSSNLSA